MSFEGYGWYLSSTAALLYCSWVVHNIVAWMKIRPFFIDSNSMFKPSTGIWVRRIYLGTLACTVPPIILQIFNNFRFFNNINDFYTKVRPYEPLFRYEFDNHAHNLPLWSNFLQRSMVGLHLCRSVPRHPQVLRDWRLRVDQTLPSLWHPPRRHHPFSNLHRSRHRGQHPQFHRLHGRVSHMNRAMMIKMLTDWQYQSLVEALPRFQVPHRYHHARRFQDGTQTFGYQTNAP